jgi:sugar phosphate isomerase/epimerase
MKIGVSEWGLHQNFGRLVNNPKPLTVMDYLDMAAGWKLDGVQIESIPADEPGLLALRDKAQKLGLYIQVEAGGFDPERIGKKLQACHVLGAKVLRTFPALKRYKKDPPLSAQLLSAEENLKRIADQAAKLGVLVGVENHQSLYLRHQDISGPELGELLDRVNSPFIGVCLDTGNDLGYCDDPVATARVLAPRTVTVHLKDYRIKRTFRGAEFAGCPMGQGAVDLPAIVRILKEQSPLKDELCLNIEAAVERVEVPFLEPEFWEGYPAEHAAVVPDFLRLIRTRGEHAEADLRIPAETGAALDEILAHEKSFTTQSIEYTRKLLARL